MLVEPDSSEGQLQDPVIILPETSALSEFQVLVLGLVARGMTDREAAQTLRVSVHRVRYAVRDAITRLSARSRAEAVFMAVKHGLLAALMERPS